MIADRFRSSVSGAALVGASAGGLPVEAMAAISKATHAHRLPERPLPGWLSVEDVAALCEAELRRKGRAAKLV